MSGLKPGPISTARATATADRYGMTNKGTYNSDGKNGKKLSLLIRQTLPSGDSGCIFAKLFNCWVVSGVHRTSRIFLLILPQLESLFRVPL
jgi:hypothetical protein